MPQIDRNEAREILKACRAFGKDYHALDSERVADLLTHADQHGYRKPKNANGSRGRYFHAYLSRRASK